MPLHLNDWADIATIVAALSVPLSALLIFVQLRVQNNLAKAANAQTLVEIASPFNILLIQDRQFAEFWVEGPQRYPAYDTVDKYRFQSMVIWWLLLHENIHFQNQRKLLDPTVYAAWSVDLRAFVRDQLGEQWADVRPFFQPAFALRVDKLREDIAGEKKSKPNP